jgi:hypothetical protein
MIAAMSAVTDPRPAPRRALGIALWVFVSSLAHGLGYAALHWVGTLPPMDFELTLPSEVQFGIVDPSAVSVPEVAAAAIASAPPSSAPEAPAVSDVIAAPPRKPHVRHPRPAPDAGVAPEPAVDAQARAVTGTHDTPALAAFAPAGAQIALRLHMGRIRESALAPDLSALLDAAPDWRLIVGGSGLDPLHDLERIYMASPDLSRSSFIIAGEYKGDADLPRRAVANLARARGVEAPWRKRGSIPIAPWANEDDTPRVVALIGPQQFAITRPDDLPRVLAVARALAKRKPAQGAAAGSDTEISDALLGLEDGEELALSVEGARAFARGNLKGVPERFDLSVQEAEQGDFAVRFEGHYEDPEAAEHALDYWSAMRDRYAGHFLIGLIGLREPLTQASLALEREVLIIRTRVTTTQARSLLGFVRNALAPKPAPRLPPP